MNTGVRCSWRTREANFFIFFFRGNSWLFLWEGILCPFVFSPLPMHICVLMCKEKKKKSCPSFHFPLPMSWQLLKKRAVNLINQIPEYSLEPAFQAWDHTQPVLSSVSFLSHPTPMRSAWERGHSHPDNYSDGSDILESRNGVRSPFYSKLKPCAMSQVTKDDG